jgi:hypothetical protein
MRGYGEVCMKYSFKNCNNLASDSFNFYERVKAGCGSDEPEVGTSTASEELKDVQPQSSFACKLTTILLAKVP